MEAAFLIMIREGFEAALVVAIVFAYLKRIGRLDLTRAVWLGVLAAVGISVGVGVVVRLTTGDLVGDARMRAFAAISALAAVVLTWMIFWMRRQSRLIKNDLEHKIDTAIASADTRRAIVGVALVAVLREGIEAALFLLAAGTDEGGRGVVTGAVLGLALAAGLAYLVYFGGKRMPMRAFFTVTGLVLIVFAAGLVAKSVMFLQVSGDLGSYNLNGVYDLTGQAWLTQQSEYGKFLSAMFGWDPRPSIEQVVAWVGFIVPVTYLFLRPAGAPVGRPVTAAVAPANVAASVDAVDA
ncbi:MAG TPA: FTR1 family protein [Acidimicrobiales bacterium]|nr:FTR1 family protein [Acidimicrobiales bacterium]